MRFPSATRPNVKVKGRWCYLYRAIDRNGALVDVMLSERRNLAAAKAFFRSAKAVTGAVPDRVTSDRHDSYPQAIRTALGKTSGQANSDRVLHLARHPRPAQHDALRT